MKAVSYLLKVLLPILVFAAVLHIFLNKIGEQSNKRRADTEVGEITKIAAILDENKAWQSLKLNDYRIDIKPTITDIEPVVEVPTSSLLVFIYDNADKEKANKLIEKLASFQGVKKIFVLSTYDSTLSELRKIEPRFYYGMSVTQMVKFAVFDSLGLEKIFPIKEDFIYKGPYWSHKVSDSIKKEVQRRNLLILE